MKDDVQDVVRTRKLVVVDEAGEDEAIVSFGDIGASRRGEKGHRKLVISLVRDGEEWARVLLTQERAGSEMRPVVRLTEGLKPASPPKPPKPEEEMQVRSHPLTRWGLYRMRS